MSEEIEKQNEGGNQHDEFFSKAVRAGKRTYFLMLNQHGVMIFILPLPKVKKIWYGRKVLL